MHVPQGALNSSVSLKSQYGVDSECVEISTAEENICTLGTAEQVQLWSG